MDEEKGTFFKLDALMDIESELKKLNSLLEASLKKQGNDVPVMQGILSALQAISTAINSAISTRR